MNRLSIGIFGAGALGSLVGAYLSPSHDVTLYTRPAHAEAIQRDGLKIMGINGEETFSVRAVSQLDNDHFDLGMIGVKAYATEDLFADLQRQGVTSQYVASLQNGLKDEFLRERLGSSLVLGCVVNEAARLVQPGVVEYTNGGCSYFGTLDCHDLVQHSPKLDVAEALAVSLHQKGLKAGVHDYMDHLTWYKFMTCVAGFSVAGALDLGAREMFTNQPALDLLTKVIDEIKAVAVHREIPLDHHDLLPSFFLANGSLRMEMLENIGTRLVSLGRSPVPSLVEDLRAGKTETEVDHTVGRLVVEARKYDLHVPTIQRCYESIKARESANQDR